MLREAYEEKSQLSKVSWVSWVGEFSESISRLTCLAWTNVAIMMRRGGRGSRGSRGRWGFCTIGRGGRVLQVGPGTLYTQDSYYMYEAVHRSIIRYSDHINVRLQQGA